MDHGKTVGEKSTRRVWFGLAIILLIGFILRAGYLAEFSKGPDFSSPGVDAEFHDYWARALDSGDWTPPPNAEDPQINSTPYLRPPGYPYFLAGIYELFGRSYFAPRIVQMLMGLASAAIAFLIGRRWFGDIVALIASALIAWYWAFIYFEGEFHATALMIFVSLIEFYLLGRFADRPRLGTAALAGLLFGLSALVLPNVLLFGPVAAIWIILRCRQIEPPRRDRVMISSASLLGLGAIAAIAPAAVRNYRVSGEFVPITTNAGINLYIGNHEGAAGFCLVEIPGLGKFETCFDYPALVRNLEAKVGRKLTHSEVDAWFRDQAMQYIRGNPARFLALTWTKALMFWGPSEISHNKEVQLERDHYAALRMIPLNFAVVFSTACVGAGAFLFTRRRTTRKQTEKGRRSHLTSGETLDAPSANAPAIAWLMALYVLTFFISILPFFNAARYRVPIVPFLLFFSAIAMARLIEALRVRRWRSALPIIGGTFVVFAMTFAWPFRFDPDISNWHYSRGYGYARTHRIDDAVSEYKAAVEADPNNAKAHFNLAALLQQKGDLAAARYHLDRAAAGGTYETEAAMAKGRVLSEAGDLAGAAAEYESVLRASPNRVDALLALALTRAQQSMFDESIRLYQTAIQAEPESPTVYYEMGMTLAAGGRNQEAIAAYRRAIELKPEFFEALNNLAAIHVQAGDFDAAMTAFQNAIKARPDSREARFNLAYVYSQMGRQADAIQLLTDWISGHPNDAEAHLRLGRAFAANGKNKEARDHFEAVLKTFPGNEAAQKGLADLGKP